MSVGYCTVKILYVIQYLIIQKSGQGEAVPAYTVKAYRGRGGIAPFILTLRTRWIWVFSFVPWPPPPPTSKIKLHFRFQALAALLLRIHIALGHAFPLLGIPECQNHIIICYTLFK